MLEILYICNFARRILWDIQTKAFERLHNVALMNVFFRILYLLIMEMVLCQKYLIYLTKKGSSFWQPKKEINLKNRLMEYCRYLGKHINLVYFGNIK